MDRAGRVYSYTNKNGTTGYFTNGAVNNLKQTGSTWDESQPDGTIWHYDSGGTLQHLRTQCGGRFTVLHDGGGRVQAIQNPFNRKLAAAQRAGVWPLGHASPAASCPGCQRSTTQ